ELVGLLTAVKLYLKRDHEGRASQYEEIVTGWCSELNRVRGVHAERAFPSTAGQPLPRARVSFDPAQLGMNRDEVVLALRSGTPSIEVLPHAPDAFYLKPMTLRDGEEEIVLDRLLALLKEPRPA